MAINPDAGIQLKKALDQRNFEQFTEWARKVEPGEKFYSTVTRDPSVLLFAANAAADFGDNRFILKIMEGLGETVAAACRFRKSPSRFTCSSPPVLTNVSTIRRLCFSPRADKAVGKIFENLTQEELVGLIREEKLINAVLDRHLDDEAFGSLYTLLDHLESDKQRKKLVKESDIYCKYAFNGHNALSQLCYSPQLKKGIPDVVKLKLNSRYPKMRFNAAKFFERCDFAEFSDLQLGITIEEARLVKEFLEEGSFNSYIDRKMRRALVGIGKRNKIKGLDKDAIQRSNRLRLVAEFPGLSEGLKLENGEIMLIVTSSDCESDSDEDSYDSDILFGLNRQLYKEIIKLIQSDYPVGSVKFLDVNFTNYDLSELGDALSGNSSILSLSFDKSPIFSYFDGEKLQEEQLAALFDGIKEMPSLKYLHLDEVAFGGRGIFGGDQIVKVINGSSTLIALHMRGVYRFFCTEVRKAFKNVIDAAHRSQSMKKIYLHSKLDGYDKVYFDQIIHQSRGPVKVYI